MTSPHFKPISPDMSLGAPEEAPDEVKQFLNERRSTPILIFDQDDAPIDETTLRNLIETAMRVPDHRKLGPWRAIMISGSERARLGHILASRFKALHGEVSEDVLAKEKARLMRAPACVTIVSAPVEDVRGTPKWEQELSAGALCMNLLYMARAAGFAAAWLTEWWAFDEEIDKALGLKENERVAGHIFIGRSKAELHERPRPDFASRISSWSA